VAGAGTANPRSTKPAHLTPHHSEHTTLPRRPAPQHRQTPHCNRPKDHRGVTRDALKGTHNHPPALANYASIARKSIHNHPDLLKEIRARIHQTRPRPVPAAPEPVTQSGVIATLREQLAAQKQCYETEIADSRPRTKVSSECSPPPIANCTAAATPALKQQPTSVTLLQITLSPTTNPAPKHVGKSPTHPSTRYR
jgi:hypothetical protein